MLWITRSHVHVDRVACPWLIRRFIDSEAQFLFVPRSQVDKVAQETGAIIPCFFCPLPSQWAGTQAL